MSKKNIQDISEYKFQRGEMICFDTNIWLRIYAPKVSGGDERDEPYTEAHKKIMEAGSIIFITPLIISEFINAYKNRRFNLINTVTKRQFREMEEYKDFLKDVSTIVNNIWKQTTFNMGYLHRQQFYDNLLSFFKGQSDINDLIISTVCSENKWLLVTDDCDFKNHNIQILTANKNLLH